MLSAREETPEKRTWQKKVHAIAGFFLAFGVHDWHSAAPRPAEFLRLRRLRRQWRGKALLDSGLPQGIEYIRSPGLISQFCGPVRRGGTLSPPRRPVGPFKLRESSCLTMLLLALRRSTPDQPSFMRPPRKRLEDYLDFINLDGGIDAFDLTKVKAEEAEGVEAQEGEIRLWIGRRFRDRGGDTGCERDDEFIYLVRRPGDDEWTERRRTTKRQDEDGLGVIEDQHMFLIPPGKFVLAFLVYSEPGDPGRSPSLVNSLTGTLLSGSCSRRSSFRPL